MPFHHGDASTTGNFKNIIDLLLNDFSIANIGPSPKAKTLLRRSTFVLDFLDANKENFRKYQEDNQESKIDEILHALLLPLKNLDPCVDPNIFRVFSIIQPGILANYLQKENLVEWYQEKFPPIMYSHLAMMAVTCQNIDDCCFILRQILTFLLKQVLIKKRSQYAVNALETILSRVPTTLIEHEQIFVKEMVCHMSNLCRQQTADMISFDALLHHMTTLCGYTSPQDLFYSREFLISLRDQGQNFK